MARIIRRTQIAIETHEIVIIRRGGKRPAGYEPSPAPDEAALVEERPLMKGARKKSIRNFFRRNSVK